ncbi:MAG: alpha/beta hydrolase [Deltaproteobacteria bacterium]|nr:alpha/beta hydrolase [Deltaproteobacteria bacterium]MBI3390928.1 alpha/beta hydrolase [Deltaproteobacteria bacterium]
MQTVRVGNINLAYYTYGTGFPVLMIQGLGGRAADWSNVPATLGERFQAITFDNRGTGKSDKPDEEYSLNTMADEAVAVLDAIAGSSTPAHVVGVSMGGMIAQLVALRHPQRVKKLALLSTTPGGSHTVPPSPMAMLALMPDLTKPPEEIVRNAMRAITAPGFADAHAEILREIVATALSAPTPQFVFARQMAAVMASDRYERLREISAPTLVLHGDVDPLVPYANGEIVASRIPGATLHTLRGCGHLAMWEQPRELTAALLEFLS